MPEKPTIAQYFLSKYYWPTVTELAPMAKSRSEVFDIAVNRFENTEGFRLDMSISSLSRHIKQEASGKNNSNPIG